MLSIRSPEARAHISDAVICYRGGALRPSVVSVWTAVVFDIVGKVRELELTGDPNAAAFITKFERVRATNDVKAALDLERSILEEARDVFELLTHQEFADLDRLRFDRHRCAHPAMNTSDDPYQPAAELVRYHLRSAITHLLAHPPVQGKAALGRVQQEVESPLFPATVAGALRVLRAGPLQRPKIGLLRDFVISTVKAILFDTGRGGDPAFVDRAVSALLATAELHPVAVANVYAADLSRLLKAVRDEQLERIVILGARVEAIWLQMPDEVEVKLDRLLETASATANPALFRAALSTPSLREKAEVRIRDFSRVELGALIDEAPELTLGSRVVLTSALDLLARSLSFDAANTTIRRVLIPLVSEITQQDFDQLIAVATENNQVEHAFETYALLEAIRDGGLVDLAYFRERINQSDLRPRLKELASEPVEEESNEDEWGIDAGSGAQQDRPRLVRAEDARVGMRVRHRKFGAGTIMAVVGAGRDSKARVAFDDENVGTKTLVVSQAALALLS